MKLHRSAVLVLVGVLLMTTQAYADRGRGGHRDVWPGASARYQSAPHYGYQHMHGGRAFWGPFGLVVGSALLYSALQPRTVTYESRTIYAPPPVTVYYAPAPAVQSYATYAVPAAPQTTVTIVPVPVNGYPVQGVEAQGSNTQPGPGASGAQWWYLCRNPAGYYPHITECSVGWEKVAPAP